MKARYHAKNNSYEFVAELVQDDAGSNHCCCEPEVSPVKPFARLKVIIRSNNFDARLVMEYVLEDEANCQGYDYNVQYFPGCEQHDNKGRSNGLNVLLD
jgi:hypothetical protein